MGSLLERSDIPASTYRLQFHAGFTFRHAAALVPYLHQLGVSHLYASPYLKAKPGSMHGYDVIDHCAVNPELGTQADFDALLDTLSGCGMSHILDTVPNHVGVATNDNAWWNDVLENGPASRYANHFDIAWRSSPRPEMHNKVLLPLLGDFYNQVLESGQLKLIHEDDKFWVSYYERRFPISPKTLRLSDGERPDEVIARYAGTPGNARSFDPLHELLDQQAYRLAYWHVASDEIDYRRFFDINDLAALRQERDDVFEETHALTLQLCAQGKVAGLRIDHPDGLYDPLQYFQRLQRRHEQLAGSSKPLYVVVEKILAPDEPLPPEWPVHGTSGYDFLNHVNGLFVDSSNADTFTRIYHEWIGEEVSFADLVYQKKKLILRISLANELHMLAHRLDRLAQRYRGWRDFTLIGITHALREIIACFGVYRTYINTPQISCRDREQIERAVQCAVARNTRTSETVFHFVRDALLQVNPDTFTEQDRADQLAFAAKFQQLTSPVTAKGIEDTAFYIYNRLVSLNEVGGEPAHFGVTPERLHAYLADRQQRWPGALSTLSTHDTKRSEDVRARINVLSEIPDEWSQHVRRWREINAWADAEHIPSLNDQYLLYQTLIGAWPAARFEGLEPAARTDFIERISAYMLKATREAKVHTSWTDPVEAYEQGTRSFIERIVQSPDFLESFEPFQQRVSVFGLLNSLAQSALKLAAPGVPDTYQGTELLDFSLVDPDNRRPVDYARRRELLAQLDASAQLPSLQIGVPAHHDLLKLQLHRRLLRLRRDHPELFAQGQYIAVEAQGPRAQHLFAFLRRHESRCLLVVVPRLLARLAGGDAGRLSDEANLWQGTRLLLPDGLRVSAGAAEAPTADPLAVDLLHDAPVGLHLLQ
jgi:(1->4)-alpha-D-glucan 1-alpha-D-glucosylmutase